MNINDVSHSTRIKSSQFTIRNSQFSRYSVELREIIGGILLLLFLWGLAYSSAYPITLSIDGITQNVHTHRRSVAKLLTDFGVDPEHSIRLSGSLTDELIRGQQLIVERPYSIQIRVDGRLIEDYSWGQSAAEIFYEVGINFSPYDQVMLNSTPLDWDNPLPDQPTEWSDQTVRRDYAWETVQKSALQFQLYRSIPIVIDEGGLPYTIRTTKQTLAEALEDAQIPIFAEDRVQPELSSSVSTGLRIFITRSIPVQLQTDGHLIKTRTQQRTVADFLTELEIGVSGLDRVEPTLDTKLHDNIEIKVTRVRHEIEIEEDIAPFETVFNPDPNLLIDTQELINPGAEGITRSRHRVRYEDEQEIERFLEDRWVAQEPDQRVISYGQRIVPSTITTEDGQTITYWRRIRMRASSYSASTAGVSPDSPWYGQTYSGEPMRRGVVAVDPRVIPMRSRVYVPRYGYGDALDTGSAIRGRRIDLGYDDDNLVLWSSWVDVFLLWPPPPSYQITWVLPNWPAPPQ